MLSSAPLFLLFNPRHNNPPNPPNFPSPKPQQVVVKALNFVCDVNPALDHIPVDTKLAFFNEMRHAYGRTALLLSGGAGAWVVGWVGLSWLDAVWGWLIVVWGSKLRGHGSTPSLRYKNPLSLTHAHQKNPPPPTPLLQGWASTTWASSRRSSTRASSPASYRVRACDNLALCFSPFLLSVLFLLFWGLCAMVGSISVCIHFFSNPTNASLPPSLSHPQ